MFVDRIMVDPGGRIGLPCVHGLRVTVAFVLGLLAAGQTHEEILADYSYVDADDCTGALANGSTRVSEREIEVGSTGAKLVLDANLSPTVAEASTWASVAHRRTVRGREYRADMCTPEY
jgi:uncharacterized protein (DUF433 family)